ncbi:MAG: 50S ribosomal protein L21 [Candidatus Omnitrophica bacterium]|nr:50S ribosomal protein L21 [Candidatus Omnitrophota bacterium]
MSTYAIIETGSKQYWVEPKSIIEVEKLEEADGGKDIILDQVLFARHEDKVEFGAPIIKGAQVICTCLGPSKGKKVVIVKYRRRKNYRRKQGHRQELTKLLVKEIKF